MMRRSIAFILASLMLCAMAGCSQDIPQQTQNTSHTTESDTAEDTAAVNTELVISQQPMAAVSVPAVTETKAADDGTALFTYTYQSMSLTLPDAEVADKVIVDFLNRVDKTRDTADSILSSAQANYSGTSGWTPYLCHITYSPTRIDQGVLSLFGSNVTYTGASHPDRTCVSANYDLITGDILTLGSILTHVDAVEPLCQLVIEKLDALADEKYLRNGYQDTVYQRFAGEESYDEDWYFSDVGLCFYFAPYEIAPYSSGVIIAGIPYSELAGIIADAYFPAEQQAFSGTVEIQPFDSADLAQFTQITELILDNNGKMLLMYTETAVQDLRITIADPSTGEIYTAFASQYLTPGDAIMVQASQEVLAAMQLTFQSGSDVITHPITEYVE